VQEWRITDGINDAASIPSTASSKRISANSDISEAYSSGRDNTKRSKMRRNPILEGVDEANSDDVAVSKMQERLWKNAEHTETFLSL
jgi:hypothetical protein